MAFQATICNVMIASPGDVVAERDVVRDVVREWNHTHATTRAAMLQAIGWETHAAPLQGDRPQAIINWQVLKQCDLLVAVFWTRLGTPTGKAPSGTVEEIDEHLKAGKPALIYFSACPVPPDGLDRAQYDAVLEFKEKCKKTGLFNSYGTIEQFRESVRRHIGQVINTDPYFVRLFSQADGSR